MPPAKSRLVHEDSRSESSTVRERQIAAAAHARRSKNAAAAQRNGTGLKDLAFASIHPGDLSAVAPEGGMQWNAMPRTFLETYRVAHNLPTSASFKSPLNQALLTNPGIGRQSPSMARKKEQRRIAKDQLATTVRKHFNGAAVSETDVVVAVLYKARNQGKSFRMRSVPGGVKKA